MSKTILFQATDCDNIRFTRLDDESVLIVSNSYDSEEEGYTVIRITADQERELCKWLAETRGEK